MNKKMMLGNKKKEDGSNSKQSKPRLTKGQIMADKLSEFAGSWNFIIGFVVFLILWMILNITHFIFNWDSYPFILLNLVLSCLAALQAPIILMSQNRAAERDRAKAERDYYINRKSEREIENMQQDLDRIEKLLHKVLQKK